MTRRKGSSWPRRSWCSARRSPWPCSTSTPADWQPIELVGPAVRPRRRQRHADRRGAGRPDLGFVPGDRARDGAARTGPRRSDRRRVAARRRDRGRAGPGIAPLINVAIYATFPLVGAVLHRCSPKGRSARPATPSASPRVVLAGLHGHELLELRVDRRVPHGVVRGRRSSRASRTVYLTVLPAEFATGLLTAGVAFSYGQHRRRRRGPRSPSCCSSSSTCCALASRRYERGEELSKRTQELASLQMGLLTTVLQTLVDARRDDRSALRRRCPLLARGGQDARASTSASRT